MPEQSLAKLIEHATTAYRLNHLHVYVRSYADDSVGNARVPRTWKAQAHHSKDEGAPETATAETIEKALRALFAQIAEKHEPSIMTADDGGIFG